MSEVLLIMVPPSATGTKHIAAVFLTTSSAAREHSTAAMQLGIGRDNELE